LSRSKIAQIATSPKRALDFTVLGAYPPADSQLNQACYDSQPDGLIACTLARGHPMMTEQELNNLIRGKEQTNTPSIVQEIVRLSQELEQKARELQLLHARTSQDGEVAAQ
jgi:hypothetical protein